MPILIKGSGGKNPSGTRNISSNGTYDVADYASAKVAVPEPSGTVTITKNGTYDVKTYNYADVSVGATVKFPRSNEELKISASSTTMVMDLSGAGVTADDIIASLAVAMNVYNSNVDSQIPTPFIYTDYRSGGNASWAGESIHAARSGATLQFDIPRESWRPDQACILEDAVLVLTR